jgi:hypothetical protein
MFLLIVNKLIKKMKKHRKIIKLRIFLIKSLINKYNNINLRNLINQ